MTEPDQPELPMPMPVTEAPNIVVTTPAAPPKAPKPPLMGGGKVAPIVPQNLDEVVRVARAVLVAGLAPESYMKGTEDAIVSKVMVGIMKGAEIGLAPLTALANIAIINGRPCLWGDGAVALVQASGLVVNWTEEYEGDTTKDDYTAVCKIWRRGQETPYIGTFSIGQARRAKLLTKGPWVEYRERMLMWRARSYAMRTGFADCLSGLSIAEEVQDIPPPPEPVNTAFLTDESKPEEVNATVESSPAQPDSPIPVPPDKP